MMKESDIRKYARLMQEFDLTALEVTEDGIRLEREKKEQAPLVAVPAVSSASAHSAAQNGASAPASAGQEAGSDYISVKSPMVGVFYAAPAENAEPYVALGDRVEKGQTLCIIEAMKLMNEIAAEDGGVIAEICVTNGQVVEYGTELFRIKK